MLCTAVGIGIGFQMSLYSVSEAESSIEVCVEHTSGEADIILLATLRNEPGNAAGVFKLRNYPHWFYYYWTIILTAGDDYTPVSDIPLSFTRASSVQCSNIFIQDDDIVELNETFSVLLTTSSSAVNLIRASATVIILDDDMVTIRWTTESNEVELVEDGTSAEVCAEIIEGEIARPVAVLYSTMDNTAQGNHGYYYIYFMCNCHS